MELGAVVVPSDLFQRRGLKVRYSQTGISRSQPTHPTLRSRRHCQLEPHRRGPQPSPQCMHRLAQHRRVLRHSRRLSQEVLELFAQFLRRHRYGDSQEGGREFLAQ